MAKPNILFIFSDDHALRTIGAYNPEYERIKKQMLRELRELRKQYGVQ
ncbi:MAG: hypothetical protein ISS35_05775 [Kiritimatiellae bacterium]|nr:hypothetical protein [Kiritimatiellia bacterium]